MAINEKTPEGTWAKILFAIGVFFAALLGRKG